MSAAASTDDRSFDPAPRPPLVERPAIHVLIWALITISTAIVVVLHFSDANHRAAAFNGQFFESSKDSAPFLIVLLAAPLFWIAGRRRAPRATLQSPPEAPPRLIWDILLAIVFAAGGFLASVWYSRPFAGLPPAIHDEYSYLFQAQTFLEGRTWLPSFPEQPELFDQMHVLNEGRFASRYFPATGAWLAPFVRAGNPWMAHWLANGLVAAGVFAVGRLLSGRAVGAVAGTLYVISPGMLVFSNMLVAHMPTMLALIVFLWAILRCRQRPSVAAAIVAGTALACAMLCRPMTAAGFALPFGIDWLWRVSARRRTRVAASASPTLMQTLALALPLIAASAGLLIYNQSITSDPFISPYQLYTDLYTPRHVYGFNNVVRGEKVAGPKTIEHYDRWADNLTPALAARNVSVRLISSSRWTLGTIPLLFALVVLLLDWKQLSSGWRLIVASILSLHAVHIPYWFTGIMDWHYVFETGPLLLLIIAYATVRLSRIWQSWSAPRLRLWWAALLGLAVLVNDVSIDPLWTSRIAIAQSEAMFARARFGAFRTEAARLASRGPIVVFVRPNPTDLHLDYVTNPPTLDGPVLVARLKPYVDVEFAHRVFPDRAPYIFDATTRQWSRLIQPQQGRP